MSSKLYVPLYKILKYKSILKHFESFDTCVEWCNFEYDWSTIRGCFIVTKHGISNSEWGLEWAELFDMYKIKSIDRVELNESQYNDYQSVRGRKKK